MRLHRIRLSNFRGVTRSEVRFALQGVTIIEGDNEVGKSCLPEALRLLFEFPDSSNAASIKAVQAAGVDVGAEVEVDMSVGEHRFTYRKRWHRDRETVLALTEPIREQLTGRDAHDRVSTILGESLDADLWAALQITQGAELLLPSFAVPTLGRALDLAAGGTTSDEHTALWDRIGAERLRYWTPGGQPRKERTASAAELEVARDQLSAIGVALGQLDADARSVAQLEVQAAELATQQSELQRAADQLSRRSEQVDRLQTQVSQIESRLQLARSEQQRFDGLNEHRNALLDALGEHQRSIQTLHTRSAAAERARHDAIGARTDADHRVAALLQQRHEANRARSEIEARLHHLQIKDELQRLSDQWNQAEAARERRNQALTALDGALVDDAVLAQLESANLELIEAETVARTGAATIDAMGLGAVVVVVDGTDHVLGAGDTHTHTTAGVTNIEIPGLVRLRIDPGADSAIAQGRVTELAMRLAALCAGAGADDLAGARIAHAARHRNMRDLADAESDLTRILGDTSADALDQRIRVLVERAGDTPPPGADIADLGATQQALDDATTRSRALEHELDAARVVAQQRAAACADLDVEHATVTATAQSTQLAMDATQGQLDAERAVLSDDDLQDSVHRSRQQVAEFGNQRAEAEQRLGAEHPDDLAELIDNARSAIERNQESIHRCQEEIGRLRIRLELEGERGLHEQLNDSQSRVEHLESAHRATEVRAHAARLLHDTFARHRTLSRQRHIAPFTARIEQLGRIVFGPDLEVQLGADLSVAHRTLDGVTLDTDSLSVGAREQLAVISRLACASLVSDHGGAPVVLDDALGWSDPARLEAMGAAISIAARDCQVIILTCTPGRYANIGDATVVRLPHDR